MPKFNSDNEIILIQKLKNGDTVAFTQLFNVYYPDMVRFAYCFVKNQEIAEEIVQDAFLKLWENRFTLVVFNTIKSYLLKLVQNGCIDWLRHATIQQKYAAQLLEHPVLAENDTENYVLHSDLVSHLNEALKKIPDVYAQAYRMNRIEAMNYREIAEKLDVSIRTVEVRIGKALSHLRRELIDYLVIVLFSLSAINLCLSTVLFFA